jgi:hypothetical protein
MLNFENGLKRFKDCKLGIEKEKYRTVRSFTQKGLSLSNRKRYMDRTGNHLWKLRGSGGNN